MSTDFDEDGYLGISDIQQTLEFLVGNEMTEGEKAEIVATVGFFSLLLLVVVLSTHPHLSNLSMHPQIFGESDIDGDRQISFVEFDNVVKKAPDFIQ